MNKEDLYRKFECEIQKLYTPNRNMKTYNLFISHSWRYEKYYDGLIDLLKDAPYFEYKDYSVPSSDPLTIRNSRYYKTELENKIIELTYVTINQILFLTNLTY